MTAQTIDGIRIVTAIEPDDCNCTSPPWDNEDGHGPVSKWTTRSKRAGELVLCRDYRSFRYYDFAAAVALARQDGWGGMGRTAGERAAHAAKADYDRLRRWCNGDWGYVGVVVTAYDEDDRELGSSSLSGIESDAGDYLTEVAKELTEELLESVCVRA